MSPQVALKAFLDGDLTRTEARFLVALEEAGPQGLTTRQLYQLIHERGYSRTGGQLVRKHIANLRRKGFGISSHRSYWTRKSTAPETMTSYALEEVGRGSAAV